MGALFARLAAAALSVEGVLGLSNVAAALGDALLLAAIALVAATAAATSLLLNAHAKRAEQGSNLAAIVAIAVAGIGSRASFCTPYGNCQPCGPGRRQGGGYGNPILYNRWDMPIFARIPKNLYGE